MNGPSFGQTDVIRDPRSALRQMTTQQLLHLGTHQVVYLRMDIHDGRPLFVIYGADGKLLASADTVDTAADVVAEHGLALVSVH